MPILLAFVLLVGGGLLYAMLSAGHIPIKLFVIIVVITVVTAWSILKSLFMRRKDEDPGLRLELEREPGVRALPTDVAARVGTRPVDSVYMTPRTHRRRSLLGATVRWYQYGSSPCAAFQSSTNLSRTHGWRSSASCAGSPTLRTRSSTSARS